MITAEENNITEATFLTLPITFCVFMSGGHSTNLIINRKLSARLHKHAINSSYILWKHM